MKERFFIVYDFVNDSRRASFVKILEKYGMRVQYSIFEFDLTKARKIELLAKLRQKKYLFDCRGEAVLILPVSRDSLKKIQRYGETVDVFDHSAIFAI